MAVQVDSGRRLGLAFFYVVGHVGMIRLQLDGFCDQTVKSAPRYQDLHVFPLRDW